MTQVELKPTELVTMPARIAFPALFVPKPVAKGNEEKKFQCAILLPPDADLRPFAECIRAAMLDAWGKVIPLPGSKNPVRDCREKESIDGYDEGWHYINVKSGYQPRVVDQNVQDVLDPDRVYPGCWCRFHLDAYAWDHPQGGKGVSFSLSAVQLVKDGDRLDGRRAPEHVFEAVEVEGAEPPAVGNGGDLDGLFT